MICLNSLLICLSFYPVVLLSFCLLQSVLLSICSSFCLMVLSVFFSLSFYLSVLISVCSSFYLFFFLSFLLYFCSFFCLFFFLSVLLSVFPYFCLTFCLSVYRIVTTSFYIKKNWKCEFFEKANVSKRLKRQYDSYFFNFSSSFEIEKKHIHSVAIQIYDSFL